jgi:hypothetical protein
VGNAAHLKRRASELVVVVKAVPPPTLAVSSRGVLERNAATIPHQGGEGRALTTARRALKAPPRARAEGYFASPAKMKPAYEQDFLSLSYGFRLGAARIKRWTCSQSASGRRD